MPPSDSLPPDIADDPSAATADEDSHFFKSPADGSWWSKLRRLRRPKERQRLLPVLIKVYAGFSKIGGLVAEEEIESSLGFLRYDYPDALYSELLNLYRSALKEPQDLNQIAAELADQLELETKILLAVQIYVLISHNKLQASEIAAFHRFMTNLGVASEAQEIVHQLSEVQADEPAEPTPSKPKALPEAKMEELLERLEVRATPPADLVLPNLERDCHLSVFRFRGLVLLKNTGRTLIIARGHQLRPGQFLRLYEGQRVVLGDSVIDYQDLIFYLNAKRGVSSTQLYLSVGASEQPFVEKVRTRWSVLRIRFGLRVEVESLQESEVLVAGKTLRQGRKVGVQLTDKLQFSDRSEITFAELRRRARELGGRFDLAAGRTEFLVSNNPGLLRPGDILLSPTMRSEILLRIRCDYAAKTGELEVLRSSRPILVDRQPIRDKTPLQDGAVIMLGEGQYLRCHFADRIIEEERNIIRQLDVLDVTHHYGKTPALDSVKFTARRGEMICVMGPSGCGKSSLMRVLAGHQKPRHGSVQMNGMSLYDNLAHLTPYISYIPHEDAFDALLTVEENLRLAAQLRSPHLSTTDLQRRVDGKLLELGLQERRHDLAGTPEEKKLSGGERKRLNIGMDMITPADVYLFDEPTSGLSSKDSEHVLEIIRGLAHNKIVFVSIHQPSARLFHLFHKALLLDKGGKMVFFGPPQEMLEYFEQAWKEEIVRPLREAASSQEQALPKVDPTSPEFIFDVLETPLRDVGGEVIFEEDSRGHTSPARRFSPNYWRDRYQTHSVFREVKEPRLRRGDETAASISQPKPIEEPPRPSRDRWMVWTVILRRAFLSKFRNKANLATTLLEAPLLALLISYVLRFNEDGDYNFAAAFHIPTYIFLTLVVGMFLGLTNSADEIIRDRVLLQRERNYNKNVAGYITAKVLALAAVSLIQNVIYLAIGNSILEIREMFWHYLLWMTLSSLSGVAIGLLVSSLVKDGKTAINIIPLVLIPQIILGGALIKYEEMNRNLDFVYSVRRWMNPEQIAKEGEPSKLRVPFICEFMPLRWSYESLVISQARLNPLAKAQDELTDMLDALRPQIEAQTAAGQPLSPELKKRSDQVKDALLAITGSERNADAVGRRIDRIMEAVRAGTFDAEQFRNRDDEGLVDPEEVFANQKVADLYSKAEIEREDISLKRKGLPKPNVFFGKRKIYFSGETDTLKANLAALSLFTLAPLVALFFTLRRQLRRVD